MEHVQKPSDKAKDGPFYEAKRKAKDGPFYEAKRKQRMDHFMKQAFVL